MIIPVTLKRELCVSAERQCVYDQSGDRYEDKEDGAHQQEERRADGERPGRHGGTDVTLAEHMRVSVSRHFTKELMLMKDSINTLLVCVLAL